MNYQEQLNSILGQRVTVVRQNSITGAREQIIGELRQGYEVHGQNGSVVFDESKVLGISHRDILGWSIFLH